MSASACRNDLQPPCLIRCDFGNNTGVFDAEDAAHSSFVRFERSEGEELILSRAAMHLHTFGVLRSIEDRTPGFVSDRFLNALRAETSVTALELCLAGLWNRVPCGYRVSDTATMAVTSQISEQLQLLALQCEQAGGHFTDQSDPDVCARCGTLLDNVVVWRRPTRPEGA